ncbi:unnamed protein product [Prunus armeniaca]|uniref:Uncharacterized protein n=1 Tax=Prunus armeniaca TaxID=36596 RepID=A0A6J5W279_PRUAR|nr:unnamed protein product [Prunus armeniaca]
MSKSQRQVAIETNARGWSVRVLDNARRAGLREALALTTIRRLRYARGAASRSAAGWTGTKSLMHLICCVCGKATFRARRLNVFLWVEAGGRACGRIHGIGILFRMQLFRSEPRSLISGDYFIRTPLNK